MSSGAAETTSIALASGSLAVSVASTLWQRWKRRSARVRERERATAVASREAEEEAALRDRIRAMVAEELASQAPRWQTATGSSMPSTAALERLIEERVTAVVARSDAAQNVAIESLGTSLAHVRALLMEALRRSVP